MKKFSSHTFSWDEHDFGIEFSTLHTFTFFYLYSVLFKMPHRKKNKENLKKNSIDQNFFKKGKKVKNWFRPLANIAPKPSQRELRAKPGP